VGNNLHKEESDHHHHLDPQGQSLSDWSYWSFDEHSTVVPRQNAYPLAPPQDPRHRPTVGS